MVAIYSSIGGGGRKVGIVGLLWTQDMSATFSSMDGLDAQVQGPCSNTTIVYLFGETKHNIQNILKRLQNFDIESIISQHPH